jgi:ABC-type sulfate transport system substrate-binding protein
MSPIRAALRPIVAILAGLAVLQAAPASADTTLLNVSYDVSRELYKDINPAFAAHWQRSAGEKLTDQPVPRGLQQADPVGGGGPGGRRGDHEPGADIECWRRTAW